MAIKQIAFINGGYVIEFADGRVIAICAYEQAEERAEDWCEENNLVLHAIDLVCGWDEADDYLRSLGVDPDTYEFA